MVFSSFRFLGLHVTPLGTDRENLEKIITDRVVESKILNDGDLIGLLFLKK